MANNDLQTKHLSTSGYGSLNCSLDESPLSSMSPRSLSPSTGWTIRYKTMLDSEPKGAWDGYGTREEFIDMHMR